MRYVFDIETDGLNATLIHCLSYTCIDENKSGTLYEMAEILDFVNSLGNDSVLIGHNIVRYDVPILERLLKTTIKAKLIDTLAVSWYLEPKRIKHGLEGYGEEFGIKKPEVKDWQNLSKEEYGFRCSEDVRINLALWNKQNKYLWILYDENKEQLDSFLNYLSFKMSCIKEQEEIGLRFNKVYCENILAELEAEKAKKINDLTAVMPKVPIITTRVAPKQIRKDNGELTKRAEEWFKLLEDKELPQHTSEIQIVKGYEDGNPNSHDQVKKWLYALGWKPENIKHVRDKKTSDVKKIPQIASKQGGGEICDSIKVLAEKEPALNLLDGLSVLSHRIGVFKAFLEDSVDGRLHGTAMGLTNTLRLQHAVIVNLPSIERKYGKEVRACLIADKEHVLCGSDLSGIEDNTKRHYIYKYDPKYVEEMSQEGFDPHLDIAMLAGLLTKEQVEAHKEGKENHKSARQKAKVVNFSATYKIGAEALARNSGTTLKEAKRILGIYWERNKAILEVEKELVVKELFTQKWQLNPVSNYWYSLRAEKDRFSTLNQGTAVYVFDVWLMFMRKLGLKIALQYHDEVLFNVKKDKKEYTTKVIQKAIELTNKRLQLNVKIGCSVQFGQNYAECH